MPSELSQPAGTWALTLGSVLSLSVTCLCQVSETHPSLGGHAVGYQDTVITVAGERYAQFGYDGPAPLFVNIWHPLHGTPEQEAPLTWRALRSKTATGAIGRVKDELRMRLDSSFIEYDLRYRFDGDEPIDYGTAGAAAVFDAILDSPTKSHRARLHHPAKTPAIVYHHGSQGLSDENLWMAEYFASLGYVFVSANFHWPLEHAMYGTPLAWGPDSAAVATLIGFARTLTATDSVFYIGHSWGAQEGWCLLHEPGLAQAFVSLETTMEWKTDSAEIKYKWPDVHHAIRTKRYPMPILMIADTEKGPPFASFSAVRGSVTQADPNAAFGHESYTSAYLLRHAQRQRFPQPDEVQMETQLRTYRSMLELIEAWFGAVRTSRTLRAERFPNFGIKGPN